MTDPVLQLGYMLTCDRAAALGAAIGLERERHDDHPAGCGPACSSRSGSAAFTRSLVPRVLRPRFRPIGDRPWSSLASGSGGRRSSRTGSGVRGLTTAASLWVVSAIGMAAGAGAWGVAVATAVIVLVSLWPLRVIEEWLLRRHRPAPGLTVGELPEAHGGSWRQRPPPSAPPGRPSRRRTASPSSGRCTARCRCRRSLLIDKR